MDDTPETTDMPSEAPQIAQDATDAETQVGAPDLESLAVEARTLAAQKGMSMAERVMVIDGWALDTFAFLATHVAGLYAQNVDLLRTLAQVTGSQEAMDGLEPLDPQQEAARLVNLIAAARLQAEVDHLREKPGAAGPRLIVPNPN